MLKLMPALLFKDELEQKFASELYNEEHFFLTVYPHCNNMPRIEAKQNAYQWAVIDPDRGRAVAYFEYCIDPFMDCVSSFWLYSFDRGNSVVILTVARKMVNS